MAIRIMKHPPITVLDRKTAELRCCSDLPSRPWPIAWDVRWSDGVGYGSCQCKWRRTPRSTMHRPSSRPWVVVCLVREPGPAAWLDEW